MLFNFLCLLNLKKIKIWPFLWKSLKLLKVYIFFSDLFIYFSNQFSDTSKPFQSVCGSTAHSNTDNWWKIDGQLFPCVEKSPLFLGTGSDWPIWTWVGDDAEWAGKLLLFSVLNIVSVHWNKLVWRPDWGQEDNSFTSVFNKLDECYHNNLPSAVLPAGDLWLVELLQCGWDLPTVQAFPNCPGNTWLTPPERKRDRERRWLSSEFCV